MSRKRKGKIEEDRQKEETAKGRDTPGRSARKKNESRNLGTEKEGGIVRELKS
jgi:hypothetical protein